MKRSILALIAITNFVQGLVHAAPLSTAFTYQGLLTDNGQLANGNYDFQFRLFDAPTNGAQVPVVLSYPALAVSNGLFITGLDFGSNVFKGTTWWLEIGLRPSGVSGEFNLLTPRQPLTPTPNALFSVNSALATTATTANSVATNVVSPTQLNTPTAPVIGQVLAFDGSGLIWTNAASVAVAWSLNGNTGTTSGANFLGTTDNQPLEFKVNGQRAFRLEPNANGAVNVVGGSPFNVIDPGVSGATIGGGGAAHPQLTASNRISSSFSVIGGGYGNSIQANSTGGFGFATIGGGSLNSVQTDATAATIAGGNGNTNQAEFGTIGGGGFNVIQYPSRSSTIGGGGFNAIRALASLSTIGGGNGNMIDTAANASTIAGGRGNMILSNAFWSSIGGGLQNMIQPDAYQSVIAGGYQNTIQAGSYGSSMGGGVQNTIQTNAQYATIGGGAGNTIQADASFATIGGGNLNTIQTNSWYTTIGGGLGNTIQPDTGDATIGGGLGNTIQPNAWYTTIGGGDENRIQSFAFHATIGGGSSNTIQPGADNATIAGGWQNTIQTNASRALIGGGWQNTIQSSAAYATIGGGNSNTIQSYAWYATIAGGYLNSATTYAFAAGTRSKANHTGAFVWADSTDADFVSTATNEFAARATGGVRFVSGVDSNGVPLTGVSLPAGSGSWSSLSDRDAKTNFAPVAARALLDRLVQLPIQSWNYKTQSESVRHIGPTAQDFHAAFKVGEDDQHIATVDADGVALAAIQGMNQKLEAQLKERDVELEALKQRLAAIEKLLASRAAETGAVQ